MKNLLYLIAKTWLGGLILHYLFAFFSFVIPGEKLIDNQVLMAFHHPTPSYPLHILLVPKAKYRSLKNLPSDDSRFEVELFRAVNELVQNYNLMEKGYRLIVNGGISQDVNHLHFHLISESQ